MFYKLSSDLKYNNSFWELFLDLPKHPVLYKFSIHLWSILGQRMRKPQTV